MKNNIFILGLAVAMLGLSACSETGDDNPVLIGHEGTIYADFLNIPVMANQEVMLTPENKSGSFALTCSSPDFGFTAAATYRVQCSLTEDFAEYREIRQDFTNCASITPSNSDVAAAIEYLSGVENDEDLPLPYQKLYMRLRAYLEQSPENTEYISNVVSFAGVGANYLAIWVANQPADIYLRGDLPGASWDAVPEYQFYTDTAEDTWSIPHTVTLSSGTEFKVADSGWSAINLGNNGTNIEPDKPYTLVNDSQSGNITLTGDFSGIVRLSLSAKGEYTVVLATSTEGAEE